MKDFIRTKDVMNAESKMLMSAVQGVHHGVILCMARELSRVDFFDARQTPKPKRIKES